MPAGSSVPASSIGSPSVTMDCRSPVSQSSAGPSARIWTSPTSAASFQWLVIFDLLPSLRETLAGEQVDGQEGAVARWPRPIAKAPHLSKVLGRPRRLAALSGTGGRLWRAAVGYPIREREHAEWIGGRAADKLAPMRPRLVALTGPLAGSALPLSQPRIWIGRSEHCDLPLADPSAAPRQCVIEWRGGRLHLRDADRRRPTFVNGLPGTERPLEAGDEIQIGQSLFVVRFDEEPARAAVRVERPAAAPQPAIVLRREDVFEGLPAPIDASPERLRRDYATLMRAGAAFSAVRGLVALARPVIELIVESVPASRGALLLTTDPSEIAPAAVWSRTVGEPIRVIEPLVDRVLRELVGIVCVDRSRPAASGAAAVLAAPLVAFEKPIGAIVLEADVTGNGGPDSRPFDEGHLRLVMAIAGMAA